MPLGFRAISKKLVIGFSVSIIVAGSGVQRQSSLAQPDDAGTDRWYANLECRNIGGLLAATKVSTLVVNTEIEINDALSSGFVAHPLWIATSRTSWVEVGYDREPYRNQETVYYWASYTENSDTYVAAGFAPLNTYKELKIVWDKNSKLWDMHFGGQRIGRAANIGGPVNTKAEAGLESTSPRNVSPRAPIYGLQNATLDNFRWSDCANPSFYQDSPARIYWVNRPFSAENRLP